MDITEGRLWGSRSPHHSQCVLFACLWAPSTGKTHACLPACCHVPHHNGHGLTMSNCKPQINSFFSISCLGHGALAQQLNSNEGSDLLPLQLCCASMPGLLLLMSPRQRSKANKQGNSLHLLHRYQTLEWLSRLKIHQLSAAWSLMSAAVTYRHNKRPDESNETKT